LIIAQLLNKFGVVIAASSYKFYSELRSMMVEEQLSLTFWKDKFPNTLKIFLIIILGMVVGRSATG
jgi:hypothetical protein